MRGLRRLLILTLLTLAGTFSPPYPSNANFPSQHPAPATPIDTSTSSSSTTDTSRVSISYDIYHR